MIHPERRRENLKKIEEMDKRDAEPLQPDWKSKCMNKKVDMVEVVRCKDCKWFINDHNEVDGWMTCTLLRQEVDKEWFCANGERKDDATD